MLIEIKQKWDVLLRCNKDYIILAFNCILKYSKETLLVLETCIADRSKNIIKN